MNSQGNSKKYEHQAGRDISKAVAAPIKAIRQVFTSKGSDRIVKPMLTLLNGAASLFKDFLNLTKSALSDFANPKKFPERPKIPKQELDILRVKARERMLEPYQSLIKPVIPEKDEREPKKPNPFVSNIAQDGISVLPHKTFTCSHKYCEGNEEFIVTNGQLSDYRSKGLSSPKSCYPCRLWTYNEEMSGKRNEPCELCGKMYYADPKYRIFYHRQVSEPLMSKKCKYRAIMLREQFLLGSCEGNRNTLVKFMEDYESKQTKRKGKQDKNLD